MKKGNVMSVWYIILVTIHIFCISMKQYLRVSFTTKPEHQWANEDSRDVSGCWLKTASWCSVMLTYTHWFLMLILKIFDKGQWLTFKQYIHVLLLLWISMMLDIKPNQNTCEIFILLLWMYQDVVGNWRRLWFHRAHLRDDVNDLSSTLKQATSVL